MGVKMNKEELIKKIKALADRGIGGEKQNAQKLLKKLMAKYDIKEEDISEDCIKEFDVKVPKFFKSLELASQILYSIVGDKLHNGEGMFKWKGTSKVFIRCTTAEFLEFEAKFNFYFYHFKKEIERFYSAFIQANMLFPSFSESSDKELTEEDFKMLRLAGTLERHDYKIQIEGAKDSFLGKEPKGEQ